MKWTIDLTTRRAFIGKTGTGKTYLARAALKLIAATTSWPIVVIDSPDHLWYGPSGQPPKSGSGSVDSPRLIEGEKLLDTKEIQVQLLQPKVPAWSDTRLLGILAQVLEHRNILIYFDEVVGVVDPHHFPVEFATLWAQGRKVNVAAWASMQRPINVPELILSQAEYWYIFRTPGIQDRKRCALYTNTPAIEHYLPEKRYFWYYDQDAMDCAILCAPITVIEQPVILPKTTWQKIQGAIKQGAQI